MRRGRRLRRLRPKVRSATISAFSPLSSAATTKQTPTSQAAAITNQAGAKFYAARTNLSWRKMLAERQAPGDTEKARDLLTKAHTAAAAHEYASLQRRAAEALQHLN